MNPETYHIPVLLRESIDGLDIKPEGTYVDVTFGGGGHSKEILSRLSEGGRLFSFDQDEDAYAFSAMTLQRKGQGERQRKGQGEKQQGEGQGGFTFVKSNFRYLKNWMRYYGVEGIDGLLADLGVSSHHFDDESRGFSFRWDAPLDMRMNNQGGMTAADIVNGYDEERLARIFHLYGEMKNSRRMAAMIAKARQQRQIRTTWELMAAVDRSSRDVEKTGIESRDKKDMARLFQALRIEVNHEMDALKEMLTAATELLKPGGRLSVITYHSLEDRIVKNVMKTGNAEGKRQTDFYGRAETPYHIINNKVITPGDEELARNPRSRSAKLRVGERVNGSTPTLP